MAIFTIVITIFVLIWMYRIEANTARTAEALARIEKKLAEKGKK